MVWRRVKIPGTASLATLHYIIQSLFGWHDDHLHQFHIYGKDYGIYYDGGVTFSDNPSKVYLDNFEFESGDKFTYEYNFIKHRLHDIRIEKIQEIAASTMSARCIGGAGMPDRTKYDEYDLYAKLAKTLARIPEATPIDHQPILDRLHNLLERLEEVKFNCKKSNHQLAEIGV